MRCDGSPWLSVKFVSEHQIQKIELQKFGIRIVNEMILFQLINDFLITAEMKRYIDQYLVYQNTKFNTDQYYLEKRKLYDYFYEIKSYSMGYCDKCFTEILLRDADKGYAGICKCDERYWIKTIYD
jgi:hypothetical protein